MFSIDLIKEKIDAFNNAIILAKANLVTNNILEVELSSVANRLTEQNLPFHSTTEMLSYLSLKIETMPQIEIGFKKFITEPLVIESRMINMEYPDILTKGERTFGVTSPCSRTPISICQQRQVVEISDEEYIPVLLRDEHAKCDFKQVKQKPTIKNIIDGMIILKNIKEPITLENTCGMPAHTITAQFEALITFKNCSITLANQSYENIETTAISKYELLSIFNVTIRQRNSEPLIDLQELHELHIKNRDELKSLHLKRIQDTWTIGYGFIALIISLVLIIVVTAILTLKFKKKTMMGLIKITSPEDRPEALREGLPTRPRISNSFP